MKKTLTLSAAALMLCASLAAAAPAGMNLYSYGSAGGSCGGPGLSGAVTGTCGTIGNAMTLISSVVVPRAIHQLAGIQQDIIAVPEGGMNDYWRLDACRGGKTTPTMNGTIPVAGACIATIWDYNAGSAPIGVEGYNVDVLFPNTLHMGMAGGVALPFDVPFDGNELGVGSLLIKNGPATCAGCGVATGLLLANIQIGESGVADPLVINQPSASACGAWLGNGGGTLPCGGATPTTNRTWGSLKSLYR